MDNHQRVNHNPRDNGVVGRHVARRLLPERIPGKVPELGWNLHRYRFLCNLDRHIPPAAGKDRTPAKYPVMETPLGFRE